MARRQEVDPNSQVVRDMIGLTNPAEVDSDLNAAKDFIDAAQRGDLKD